MVKTSFIPAHVLDVHDEKEARKNPLYDPKKRTWVVYVYEKWEVSVIRRNFRTGFITTGYGHADSDEKIIVGSVFLDQSKQEREKRLKFLKERARIFAAALNHHELHHQGK